MAWKTKERLELKVWTASPFGVLKINIDPAVKSDFVAIACICYDYQGIALWARSEIYLKMSSLLAKVLAVGEAWSRGLQEVMFDNDSLTAVLDINDPNALVEGESVYSIEANRDMALQRPLWRFLKVSRQANNHADCLAKWAADCSFFGCIPLDFLPSVLLRQNWCFDPP